MKQWYEQPIVEIVAFEAEDVITTSIDFGDSDQVGDL